MTGRRWIAGSGRGGSCWERPAWVGLPQALEGEVMQRPWPMMGWGLGGPRGPQHCLGEGPSWKGGAGGRPFEKGFLKGVVGTVGNVIK